MTAFPIPGAALDDRLGFVGTSGSGKTYGAGTAVERIIAKSARVNIIDPLGVWYGLRLKADGETPSGHDVVIFGGPHGDIPINDRVGALVGETVAQMRESAIVDLSLFETKAAERRFMLEYLTALYRKATGEPLHLIIDEADLFAPQQIRDRTGEPQKLLGMVENIVRRGRIKGFIPWLITQRPAVINKDVLSQVDGLIGFMLTSSQDRDQLGDWIKGNADLGEWPRIRAGLASLPKGRAIIWLPSHRVLGEATFPKKRTFDSSRTPKRGEAVQARSLGPLDVSALKDRMSDVEAEAKANDPRELRARIAELERAAPKSAPAVDTDAIYRDGYQAGHAHGFNAGAAEGWRVVVAHVEAARDVPVPTTPEVALKPRPAPTRPPTSRTVRQAAPRPTGSDADQALPSGEHTVLIAVAQSSPDGLTRDALSVLTGFKRSTRNAYAQRLMGRDYIEVRDGRLVATETGIAVLGADYEPLPTGSALFDYWMRRLPSGEASILRIVADATWEGVSRETIREQSGFKRSTANAYVQRLKTRELVNEVGGDILASERLFD